MSRYFVKIESKPTLRATRLAAGKKTICTGIIDREPEDITSENILYWAQNIDLEFLFEETIVTEVNKIS